MSYNLSDLNEELFTAIKRLNDDDLSSERLEQEIKRTGAISSIAKDVVSTAKVVLEAQRIAWDAEKPKEEMPPMLEG